MALIPCPESQRMVSFHAESCPNCGFPNPAQGFSKTNPRKQEESHQRLSERKIANSGKGASMVAMAYRKDRIQAGGELSKAKPSIRAIQDSEFSPGRGGMRFKNLSNGFTEEISSPWLWVLLFGFFYFAVKGVWTHAIMGLILAIPTWGLTWLIYPFFASSIMRKHYLRKSWIEI